jgi:antitoxin ParD1/3/4
MPTHNLSLTPKQDGFVDTIVKAGEYQNASEAVRDALKLKALRLQIKAGVNALYRGDFVEVEDIDLERHLDRLKPASGKRAR